jgi:hypothetical protein
MSDYDVFNGDADGICALTQLRLAEPRPTATLVTGVKRDIDLLQKVQAKAGDRVTVLDIAMEKNIVALERVLAAGSEVFYADHHVSGPIPRCHALTALINEAPDVCTSLLVNGHLKNRFRAWAVVGAFGDNLRNSALAAAKPLSVSSDELQQMEKLGIYINYNGYGEKLEDLRFHPEELFRRVSRFDNPIEFIRGDGKSDFEKLEAGYADDMSAAEATPPLAKSPHAAVFMFPDEPWARRVSGVYSNDLVNKFPDRAHAVLTAKRSGTYLVSVRAPLNRKTGAADLCRQFPTGGGRAAAAGINDLPEDQLTRFIDTFQRFYSMS